MKRKLLILSLVSLMALTGCKNKDREGTWKNLTLSDDIKIIGYTDRNKSGFKEVDPFNTSMILRYFFDSKNTNNDEIEENIVQLYSDELVRLHKIFDRHYYYFDENNNLINNVAVINDSYGSGEEIQIDEDLFNCFKLCYEYYELTNGMFNIFTGSLTDYWDDKFDRAYGNSGKEMEYKKDFDPYYVSGNRMELESIVAGIPHTFVDYKNILTFNEENHTVKFNEISSTINRPYISLGGVAKGYATDIIKDKLIHLNYLDGVLFSGGSSLESLSNPIYSSKKKGLEIQTKVPETFGESAFSIYISKQFNYSTSGNYGLNKNYVFLDDENNVVYRHHIINPYTGYPESYFGSVSLLSYSLSSAELDILSTTLMNMNIVNGLAIRSKIDSDLEIFYITEKYNENYTDVSYTVHATSNVNNTLSISNGVILIYEK